VIPDALEEVLRQNLNLRRELATEVGKARNTKTGNAPFGVNPLLDLSNVSRRLGLDVASAE
jgi:hypothetical protein